MRGLTPVLDAKMDLKDHIRSIPDFPKPGILFYDISTLLRNRDAWKATVDILADRIAPYEPELLVGSPMCTAYSAWQRINKQRNPSAYRRKLRAARQHMEFVCV